MCRNSELQPLRRNLQSNLWRIINREPIKTIPFMEYLIDILINRHREITITSTKFLKKYSDMLTDEYAIILDHIQSNAIHGDIIQLEKYVKEGINGNITKILDEFVENYEKSKKDN